MPYIQCPQCSLLYHASVSNEDAWYRERGFDPNDPKPPQLKCYWCETGKVFPGKPYTREEIDQEPDSLPQRGTFCPKCKTWIPRFADLSVDRELHLREIQESKGTDVAIKELREATGCSIRWAKVWVNHANGPERELPESPPCPYCSKPLRSEKAKQCVECGMDWHDPDNLKKLG